MDKAYFFAKCHCDEESGMDMLNIMAKTGKINSELWERAIIVSQDLLNSLTDAYRNRKNSIITIPEIIKKEVSCVRNDVSDVRNTINSVENPQRKGKETKGKETKGKDIYISSPKDSGTDVCPHQKIIDKYHEILPSLPMVKKWPDHLQKILRTRWKEDSERQSIEWWAKFFEYVKISPFLMGKKSDFLADLEWLIRPRNFTKIANGRYHQYIKNNVSSKTERTINNLTEWMEENEQ
jgi:hypothetical protein